MEFRFDANQEFQVKAIEAVADLFDGQAPVSAQVQFKAGTISLAAIANRLDLSEARVLANLQAVQKRNRIRPDAKIEYIAETINTNGGEREVRFPNYSVEMETGTGKTYVYIRTILELFQRYGMRKFIIVVPSVAVREGVLKTLKITARHLKALYGNPVYRYYVYDSGNLSQVRQFAQTDSVEVMVMTIDSFNKSSNIMRQSRDQLQGETPIHLVQAARPILILDEPQNMESDKSVAALAALDPLFALRYSATHRVPYNIVYRLTPAQAYRQGLVKKVEVDSVVTENDENRPYVRVESIQSKKNKVTARLAVHKLMKTGAVKETILTFGPGASLTDKTARQDYAGFDVDEINPGGQFVRFANNVELMVGQEQGADKGAIFAAQIRHTVEEHFRKQERLRDSGIKVLSLFFIDRVANYVGGGMIRRLFDEAFDNLKAKYPAWKALNAPAVQAAYFAEKRHKGVVVERVDSVSGKTKEDEAAYDLIMRDKESLLSFPEPSDDEETRKKKQVCFIFSHSALREGWDNPNIFQVCTLRQVGSERQRRQQVGRGIRLAVDQSGERVFDDHVNILTVVANESFGRFVEEYQSEIAFEYRAEIEAKYGKPIGELTKAERRKVETEFGEGILPPPPRNARAKKAKLRKSRALSDDFKELWNRIKHKTRYSVQIDTKKLLDEVVPAIEQEDISPPRVTITKAEFMVGDDGIFDAMQISAAKTVADLAGRYPLPNLVDVMANLMEHTTPPVRVTRRTLLELFRRLDAKKAAIDNPHEWATTAVRILKEKLADHLVNGIEYEKIGQEYLMEKITDERTVELFTGYVTIDESKDKTLYNRVPYDSGVEKKFIEDLEQRRDVRLYVKLPSWFTVPTPVGDYNPDWAIVMDGPEANGKPILYLVYETKSSPTKDKLRPNEWRKIKCGAAHFGSRKMGKQGALDGVDYRVVTSASELP